jgi:hypothetical protein
LPDGRHPNLMTDARPLGYFIALQGTVCEPG